MGEESWPNPNHDLSLQEPTPEQRTELMSLIEAYTRPLVGRVLLKHSEVSDEKHSYDIAYAAHAVKRDDSLHILSRREAFGLPEYQERLVLDEHGNVQHREEQYEAIMDSYGEVQFAYAGPESELIIAGAEDVTPYYTYVRYDANNDTAKESDEFDKQYLEETFSTLTEMQLRFGTWMLEALQEEPDTAKRISHMHMFEKIIVSPAVRQRITQDYKRFRELEDRRPELESIQQFITRSFAIAQHAPMYFTQSTERVASGTDMTGIISTSQVIQGRTPTGFIANKIDITVPAHNTTYDEQRFCLGINQAGELYFTGGYFYKRHYVFMREMGILEPVPEDPAANNGMEATKTNSIVNRQIKSELESGFSRATRADLDFVLDFLRSAHLPRT